MRVGIYAGSAAGTAELRTCVVALIGGLADRGHDFVYGGGSAGIMGLVADTAIARGAPVTGVLPPRREGGESPHRGLTRIETAPDRPTRRARILELSDVVVALPGGPGTLEELAEAVNLRRIGFTTVKCAVFNASGFFDPFLRQLDNMVRSGFLRERRPDLVAEITTACDIEALAGSGPTRRDHAGAARRDRSDAARIPSHRYKR
ncbi:LOG family protein [Micromonospora sp. NPDC048830]|uniref:LOG family protein n=1 Tax=Micromonospora sp. NPDC048830 TaxID=3364257 RepID=UPI0037107E56